MSGFKPLKQRQAEQCINMMFKGLDDEILRTVLLCAYAGEDETKLDDIKKIQENDLAELQKQFEIIGDASNATAVVLPDEPTEAIILQR